MINWEECGRLIGHCWIRMVVGLDTDPSTMAALAWGVRCQHCGAVGEGLHEWADDQLHPILVKPPPRV